MSQYLEKNLHSLKNALLTFSSLVFFANFIYIDSGINTALYFSNVMSLIVASIMLYYYPEFLFDKYHAVFSGRLNKDALNTIGIFLHILPVYLFKDRQSITDLLDINIILGSGGMLLVWYILFKHLIPEVYPMNETSIFYICFGCYLLWIMACALV